MTIQQGIDDILASLAHSLRQLERDARKWEAQAGEWKAVADRQRAEIDRLRAALQTIRDSYGKVCQDFELCTHPACQSSYGAWALADAALQARAGGEGET